MAYAKHCLLIDDDHDDQLLFSIALKELNKSITFLNADNGLKALSMLTNEHTVIPDIIFLDLNMPIINGFDFLTRLKENSKLCNIPVVIYSTSCREEDIARTKNLGAFAFITKPYYIPDLTALLSNFF